MSKSKILIVGLGKMGESICRGILRSNRNYSVSATVRDSQKITVLKEKLKIPITSNSSRPLKAAHVIILCVKPQQAEQVVKSISKDISPNCVCISVCASITQNDLKKWSGGKIHWVRVMPNLPAVVGESMTVICKSPPDYARNLALVHEVFACVGRTVELDEELLDAATGLSGAGPAFAFLILEALSEAGVKIGIPRQISTLLAAQTLLGSALMVLKEEKHPAALKDDVTTPAGCTIDGLMALEEGKLRATIVRAVVASARRSRSLRESRMS